MVVKITVLDGNCSLVHVWRNVFLVNDKTIIFGAGIFPKYYTVAIEISIDCLRDGHFVEANFVKVFLVIQEKAANANHHQKEKHADDLENALLAAPRKPPFEDAFWMKARKEALHGFFW